MDYQQKLAEKLVILNERGKGVLVRMNYIKKVRDSESYVTETRKRNLTSYTEKRIKMYPLCSKKYNVLILFEYTYTPVEDMYYIK